MEGGSSTAGRCDAVTLQAREAVRWLQMVESRRYGAAFSRVGSDPIAGGHVSYAWQRKSGRNSVAKRSERGIDALVPHFARIGNVALPAASAWERQSVRPRSRLVSGETRLGALYRPRAMRRRSWTAWLVKLASPTATGNFGSRCRARWYARRRHVEAGPGRDRRLPSISVPPCADFRHMDVPPAVQRSRPALDFCASLCRFPPHGRPSGGPGQSCSRIGQGRWVGGRLFLVTYTPGLQRS